MSVLRTDEELRLIFSKNFRRMLSVKGKNTNDIVRDLDVPSSTVSSWHTGQKMPRMGNVEKLANYFGCLKSDLLEYKPANQNIPEELTPQIKETIATMRSLNDAGQQKVSDYATDLKCSGQYKYIAPYSIDDPDELEVCDREWIALPLVGSAAAGSGNWRDASAAYWVDFPSDKIPPHATAAFEVDGNSMTGLFEDGDIVFVNHKYDRIDGKPYVLDVDGMIIVKKLYWEQGRLRIVSNNPDWEDRFLPYELGENAYIYGIVVGHYTPTRATAPRSRFEAL